MARTVRHYRMPPDEIEDRFRELGLTPWQFAALFETRRETVSRWLRPVDHCKALDPPFWVTIALDLLRLPTALERVRELHEANKMSAADEHDSEAL